MKSFNFEEEKNETVDLQTQIERQNLVIQTLPTGHSGCWTRPLFLALERF